MNILVTAASRHGSTWEIAEAIAGQLAATSGIVDLRPITEGEEIAGYDAIVAGSGVYMGRWLPEAVRLVNRMGSEVAEVPLWLFSSGPLGDRDAISSVDPAFVKELLAIPGVREHMIFDGKLATSDLGFVERMVTRGVKAPKGDFRNWDAVASWTSRIAREFGERPCIAGGQVDPIARDERTRPGTGPYAF